MIFFSRQDKQALLATGRLGPDGGGDDDVVLPPLPPPLGDARPAGIKEDGETILGDTIVQVGPNYTEVVHVGG